MVRWLTALVLVSGCASFSSVQTADTLGKGRIQGAVEPGVWGAVSSKGPDVIPHVDGAVRFGVTDRLDLGVRAGSSFLEFQGKVLLTTPGDPALAVSLAPSVGGIYSNSGIINLALPVLIGFKTASGNELVLGPRVQGLFIFDGTNWTTVLGVGTSVGFLWRITENFGLMPEVAAVLPVLGGSSASLVFGGVDAGGVFMQFKLGLIFGSFRPLAGEEEPPPAPRPRAPVPARVPAAPPPQPPGL